MDIYIILNISINTCPPNDLYACTMCWRESNYVNP